MYISHLNLPLSSQKIVNVKSTLVKPTEVMNSHHKVYCQFNNIFWKSVLVLRIDQ